MLISSGLRFLNPGDHAREPGFFCYHQIDLFDPISRSAENQRPNRSEMRCPIAKTVAEVRQSVQILILAKRSLLDFGLPTMKPGYRYFSSDFVR